MSDAMSIALSGLRTAETRVTVAADNIANQNSGAALPKEGASYEGYQPRTVDASSQVGGGVRPMVNPVDPAFVPIAQAGGETEAAPNVNVAEQTVNMMMAEQAYKANAAVIRTDDEMKDTVLDIGA